MTHPQLAFVLHLKVGADLIDDICAQDYDESKSYTQSNDLNHCV